MPTFSWLEDTPGPSEEARGQRDKKSEQMARQRLRLEKLSIARVLEYARHEKEVGGSTGPTADEKVVKEVGMELYGRFRMWQTCV